MKKRLILIVLSLICLAMIAGAAIASSAAAGDPTTKIKGNTLSLQDSIELKYAVEESNFPAGAERGVLVWTEPHASYTFATEGYYETSEAGKSGKYFVFVFDQIKAKMLADTLYAVSYIKNGETVYYSAVNKYSVLDYCYNQKDSTSTTANGTITLPQLLTAIRNYGAAAQQYMGYNLDRLANATFYKIKLKTAKLTDSTTSGLFQEGELVTMNANAGSGNTIIWTDTTGATVGTGSSVQIAATREETYTATYHNLTWHEEVPAVTSSGVIAHYSCSLHTDEYFDAEYNRVENIVIPNDHNWGEWIPEVPATCSRTGVKAHYECSDENCSIKYADENFEKIDDLTIPKLPHTPVTDEAVPATCTTNGKTEGSHCSVCGATIVAQESTEMIAHDLEFIEEVPATCGVAGYYEHYECTMCHQFFLFDDDEEPTPEEDFIIEPLEHEFGDIVDATVTFTEAGHVAYQVCANCGCAFDLDENKIADSEEEVPIIPGGIHSVDDMLALRDAVDGGETFNGETINLWVDLDMTGTGFNGIGMVSSKPFGGSFDGHGHTINITQSQTNTDGNAGLFNFIRVPEDGTVTIQNLHVTGTVSSTVSSDNYNGYIGGIVGAVDAGKAGNGGVLNILNCQVSTRFELKTTRHWAIGGMIGFTRHEDNLKPLTINIDSCVWDGVINSGPAISYGGGLIGYTGNNKAGRTLTINISNVVAAGKIMTNQSWDEVGYLIGYAKGSFSEDETAKVTVNIENVVSTGKITYAANNSKEIGGFIGKVDGSTELNLTNFYYMPYTIRKEASITSPVVGVGEATTSTSVAAVTFAEIDALTGSDFSSDAFSTATYYGPCPTSIVETFGYPKALDFTYELCDEFEIGTVEELLEVRDNVNDGRTYEGKTIKLTADIDTTGAGFTGIGYATTTPFSGNFDGQGHTVILDQSIVDPDGNGGMFGFVRVPANSTVTIQNLCIKGTIKLTNTKADNGYVGALISAVDAGKSGDGGVLDILNVQSSVRMNMSPNRFYAISGMIGFVRHEDGLKSLTVNFDSCLWDGVLNFGPAAESCGGFIGYTGMNKAGRTLTINLTNSVCAGKIMLNTSWTDDTGLLFGYLKGNTTEQALIVNVTDVLCCGTITSSTDITSTKWVGLYVTSGVTTVNLTNFRYISFVVRGKGEITLDAGNGTTNGEAIVLTEAEMAALTGADFADADKWSFADCYIPCPTSIVETFGYSSALDYTYQLTDTFEIATAEQLLEVASNVNNGKTYNGKTVKLTADIDLTDTEWRSIGTRGNGNAKMPFKGTFDGQGHTVNLKSYTGAQSEGGLFGYLGDGAVVMNVRLTGEIHLQENLEVGCYGSLVGCCAGTVDISNVWSSVNFHTDGKWFKYSGGLIGIVDNNANSDLTVTDCIYDGHIHAASSVQESGGFFGYSGQITDNVTKSITFTRCIFGGTFHTNNTQGYHEDTGLFMGYQQNNSNNKGKLTVTLTDCIISGYFSFGERSVDVTKNCAIIIGWAGFQNEETSYTFTNVYYRPGTYLNGTAIAVNNVTSGYEILGATAKTAEELKALTLSDFSDADAWTLLDDFVPCPTAIATTFEYPPVAAEPEAE